MDPDFDGRSSFRPSGAHHLRFRVVTSHDDAVHVFVTGAMDMASANELLEFIEGAGRSDLREVVLDLGEVKFMDSFGVNALLQAARLLRDREGGLSITNVRDEVRMTISMAGVGSLLGVDPG